MMQILNMRLLVLGVLQAQVELFCLVFPLEPIHVLDSEGHNFWNERKKEFLFPAPVKGATSFSSYGVAGVFDDNEKRWFLIDVEGKRIKGISSDKRIVSSEGLMVAWSEPNHLSIYGASSRTIRWQSDTYSDAFIRFSEGGIPVKSQKEGKWGMLDINGKIIIECEYEKISLLSEGTCIGEIKGQSFFLSNKGIHLSEGYEEASSFSSGIAVIKSEGIHKVIGRDFVPIYSLPSTVKSCVNYKDKFLIVVYQNGKGNLMTLNGESTCEMPASFIGYPLNGMFPFSNVDGSYGFMDSMGVIRLEPKFYLVGYSESLQMYWGDENVGDGNAAIRHYFMPGKLLEVALGPVAPNR